MGFNAVRYATKLKNAGLNDRIADVHAEELDTLLHTEIATKADLNNAENRMVIRLGKIVVTCTGIITIMIWIMGYIMHQ